MADEGEETRLAALGENRRDLPALTHGLHLNALWPCDHCAYKAECPDFEKGGRCEQERTYLVERVRRLNNAAGIDWELDAAQIRKVAWLELLMDRGMRFLAATGSGFRKGKDGLQAVPALGTLLQIMATHGRVLEQLGQTPARRAKLKAGVGYGPAAELTRAIIESDAEKQAAWETEGDYSDEE